MRHHVVAHCGHRDHAFPSVGGAAGLGTELCCNDRTPTRRPVPATPGLILQPLGILRALAGSRVLRAVAPAVHQRRTPRLDAGLGRPWPHGSVQQFSVACWPDIFAEPCSSTGEAIVEDKERTSIAASLIALQACVRVLIATSSEPEEIKRLLPAARAEAQSVLEELATKDHPLAPLAELSLAIDHQLYVLTTGLIGEPPDS